MSATICLGTAEIRSSWDKKEVCGQKASGFFPALPPGNWILLLWPASTRSGSEQMSLRAELVQSHFGEGAQTH